MMQWGENVKKRRSQQIRSIRDGQLPGASLHFPKEWEMGEETTLWKQQERPPRKKKKWLRRLMIQTLLSGVLLALTWLAFQTESFSAQRTQAFITEAMNRPFNFQAMTAWYQERLGTSPTVLPTFRPERPQKAIWRAPVLGKVVLPFNQERNGLVLRTAKQAVVVAPADGRIVFAGHKDGLGQTVMIQHTDGQMTWFALLDSVAVKEQQWVKQGERIGQVKPRDEQSFVYVALKKAERFVDPAAVMPFE